MKIAILGTRGIPNYHGGFEQFAEFFSVYLAQENHEVYVYNSSSHPYKDKEFMGVKIIHCNDPEDRIGTPGQFIYDFNCILDSRKRNFDVLLQLGYTSSSIWRRLLPKKTTIVTNMDGLEWKRSKYSSKVQRFLKYAENLAVKSSDFLVSDSIGIQNYLKKKYDVGSEYIAYGAEIFDTPNVNILKEYHVQELNYNMLVARMEPENNIEIILEGAAESEKKTPFLVVGKHNTNKFGGHLKEKFKDHKHIRFIGGVYNLEHLNNLRYYSNLYFHGHSVGGTNPSLLEAMSSNALIAAHNNDFNRFILKDNAFYFVNTEDVKTHLDTKVKTDYLDLVNQNQKTILKEFTWNLINSKYENYLIDCFNKKQKD